MLYEWMSIGVAVLYFPAFLLCIRAIEKAQEKDT